MPKFNDLNLKEWKESDIDVESLWIIDGRKKEGKHSNFYHGNFIPQIPYQMISRYTKKGETVLDPFLGSGTTAIECENLGRNFIGIDIQEKMVERVKKELSSEKISTEFICGDSQDEKIFVTLKKEKKTVQHVILHPPYFDIIKFSEEKGDISQSKTLQEFLDRFTKIVQNSLLLLEKNRYISLVIGDKYANSQLIPLGFYCMYAMQKLGLTLKGTIVKNMSGNRGKQNQEGIWKYRALSSDYYIFKHEYIFVFKNT